MQLIAIIWTFDPEIFSTEIFGMEFAPRWYGFCFAMAFLIGYFIAERMWKHEGLNNKKLDSLLIAMVVGAIVGARLGHVFFYEWAYYSKHLWEIPNVHQGGLASHGGLLGIIITLWLWSRWVSKKPVLWVYDRMVVPGALGGFFIRLGNLFNHEIVGNVTDVPWAFQFSRYTDQLSRHPVQLYESLAYLGVFILLYFLYFKKKMYQKLGYLSGVAMIGIFGARFILEFFKENQIDREAEMSLNMGHWLSIPIILIGVWLIFKSSNTKDQETK